MQRQYALGTAHYVQLLIAQQQSQQTKLLLIEAQANRLVDSVAFYQAMGGGIYGTAETVAATHPVYTPK